MEVSKRHNLMDMQDAEVAMNLELQRKLGRIVLGAMSADQRQLVLPVATTIFAGHMW